MFSAIKNKSIAYIGVLGSTLSVVTTFPLQAFAAQCAAPLSGSGGANNFTTMLNFPTCIINTYLVPGAIALEIIFFIAGIIMYLANGDNDAKRAEASQFMLWGILAIFVTLSVWGLVAIIRNTLQI